MISVILIGGGIANDRPAKLEARKALEVRLGELSEMPGAVHLSAYESKWRANCSDRPSPPLVHLDYMPTVS